MSLKINSIFKMETKLHSQNIKKSIIKSVTTKNIPSLTHLLNEFVNFKTKTSVANFLNSERVHFDRSDWNLFLYSVRTDFVEGAKLLLQYGADINK